MVTPPAPALLCHQLLGAQSPQIHSQALFHSLCTCKDGLLPPSSPRTGKGPKVCLRRDSLQLIKSQFRSGEEKTHIEPKTCMRPRLVPDGTDLHRMREYSVIWVAIPEASSANREA